MKCKKCECELTPLDIALTKKLINRGATEFWCIECLSQKFGVTTDYLKDKAKAMRDYGCTLFTGMDIK